MSWLMVMRIFARIALASGARAELRRQAPRRLYMNPAFCRFCTSIAVLIMLPVKSTLACLYAMYTSGLPLSFAWETQHTRERSARQR